MATGTQLEKTVAGVRAQAGFADRLGALVTRGRVHWAGLRPSQRLWAGAAVGLIAALLGGLLWYGLRTDWRTLYADLDAEDARQIAQTLSQAQVPFDVAANGGTIRVPAAELDKARLATAAKGGVKSGRLGFEIFDKPNWVGSEFDEQVNYQRALEGELEHTVGTLADVESARVHLVLPHDSLFRDQERPAKGSVVLKLRHRSLADGEAEAIRNLVASAVDGLTADRVVLVDAAGHLPLGPKTADAMRLTEEQALEEKLVSTLEPVTGPGNVRASVTLDYDSQATEQTEESYDPEQTVTLSMQRTEQVSGSQPVAAGVPGTASNAPNTQALPVYPQATSQPQSTRSEAGTYGAAKTVRHVLQNPGRLRRLTAAIVVNDRMAQPAARDKAAVWQSRSAEELRNLTALAQAAVGFESSRGDLLTVEDLSFEANHAQAPPSSVGQLMSTVESSPVLVKYAAILSGILAIVAFGVRPAVQRIAGSPPSAAKVAPKELASNPAQPVLKPPEPVELDPEKQRSQEIFEQVADHLKREPSHSSRLLQSWIHQD
jgi:flagellar M-ring protein FliF